MLILLPVDDSEERAEALRRALDLDRDRAAGLGRSAYDAILTGGFRTEDDRWVDWSEAVHASVAATRSFRPDACLPDAEAGAAAETRVRVANETTLAAAKALVDRGATPLALNFANGITPGGGFLLGARAQEEALCRSSALFATLEGDPMYTAHRARPEPDSTDWAILSPRVPVFRDDAGTVLADYWFLDVITCAAPVAWHVGYERSAELLRQRIHRVLAIARAFEYRELVLGAWGCGAFGNDPKRTARSFREVLEGPMAGAFDEVVFPITDWSPDRRFLRPFRDVFATSDD